MACDEVTREEIRFVDSTPANEFSRWTVAALAPLLLGGVLLLSAALKVEQLIVGAAVNQGLLSSRAVAIVLVECELLLGIWLLSGVGPRTCRQVAMSVFAVFAAVTLYQGLTGQSSCGCFGRMEVNPWWMLVLDLFALASLWKWQPTLSQIATYDHRLRHTVAVGAFLLVGGPALYLMANYEPAQLTADGVIVGEHRLVILEPEEWTNNPLPIANYIDVGSQLTDGQWTVVLYHHDCPKCQEALPRYEQLAQMLFEQPNERRIALIEVPPYGQVSLPSNNTVRSIYGRLSEEREWFVQAPIEIVVENGIVKSASTELPSLVKIDRLLDSESISAFLSPENRLPSKGTFQEEL